MVKPFNHGSVNFILRFKNLAFKTFERKGQNKFIGYIDMDVKKIKNVIVDNQIIKNNTYKIKAIPRHLGKSRNFPNFYRNLRVYILKFWKFLYDWILGNPG